MTWCLLTSASCGTALIKPAWTTPMPGKCQTGRREQPCLSGGGNAEQMLFLLTEAVMELGCCNNAYLKQGRGKEEEMLSRRKGGKQKGQSTPVSAVRSQLALVGH